MKNPLENFSLTPASTDIVFDGDERHRNILFKDLKLDQQNPESPKVSVLFKKEPVPVAGSFGSFSVSIDKEPSELMRDIEAEVLKLGDLPEAERVRAVMKLLREKVDYAFDDAVAAVYGAGTEKTKWIIDNVGVKGQGFNIPLSKIFENKFGVCGHISSAFLWMASKVGLNGVFLTSKPNVIKNVINPETGLPLFKSVPLGEQVPGHAWAEIKMTDGSWMPVDPTTRLVGDNPDSFRAFQDANYKATTNGIGISTSSLSLSFKQEIPTFLPGQAVSQGNFWVGLAGPVKSGGVITKEAPTEYSGDANIILDTMHAQSFGQNLSMEASSHKE